MWMQVQLDWKGGILSGWIVVCFDDYRKSVAGLRRRLRLETPALTSSNMHKAVM